MVAPKTRAISLLMLTSAELRIRLSSFTAGCGCEYILKISWTSKTQLVRQSGWTKLGPGYGYRRCTYAHESMNLGSMIRASATPWREGQPCAEVGRDFSWMYGIELPKRAKHLTGSKSAISVKTSKTGGVLGKFWLVRFWWWERSKRKPCHLSGAKLTRSQALFDIDLEDTHHLSFSPAALEHGYRYVKIFWRASFMCAVFADEKV